MNHSPLRPAIATLLLAASGATHAVFIGNDQGGAEFPQGPSSFADAVAAFNPVIKNSEPTATHLDPSTALGLPDYSTATAGAACPSAAACKTVSLGDGGMLTLRFVDNLLTGSGDSKADLWIFEAGPDVEDTFVEISVDGWVWNDVGKVAGSTAGVDIDAFGHGSAGRFGWVRLRDDPDADGQSGYSVGADIDAVGAISSVAVVPEPSSLALLLAGLGAIGGVMRRRRV